MLKRLSFLVVALALLSGSFAVSAEALSEEEFTTECLAHADDCSRWLDWASTMAAWEIWIRASVHADPFLTCTRSHESSHTPPLYDNGYGARNPSGKYLGAYQFSQSTWNNTARHLGALELVGVDPATASVWDQDRMALDLYQWQGKRPWLGRC